MLQLTEGSKCCDALESVKKMRARRMEMSTAPETCPINWWVVGGRLTIKDF